MGSEKIKVTKPTELSETFGAFLGIIHTVMEKI